MSTKSSIATSAEAAEGGTVTPAVTAPVGPTVTHYQQLAAAVMTAIDELAATLPQLEVRHVSMANFARTHVNVSNEFLGTAISAVEQTPELQLLNKLDVTVGRDTLQLLEAFRSVEDKITAFQKDVRFKLMSKKADLVAAALQVYAMTKALTRDGANTALASHVDNMARDLGPRGRTASPAVLAKRAAKAAAAAARAVAKATVKAV